MRPAVFVLGDLMLDQYIWGDADRVSPEAPVLVLRADKSEIRPGGAASVAALLCGLEANVTLLGVVGDDPEGRTLRRLLDEAGAVRSCVVTDPGQPTTHKQRFIGRAAGRHPHQILRVDHEERRPLPEDLEQQLLDHIVSHLEHHQAVLISDYGKGVCTPRVLSKVFEIAATHGLPVIVDPTRGVSAERYHGATHLKPNRAEAEQLTALPIVTPDDALVAARRLCELADVSAAIVTLDALGLVYATREGMTAHLATHPRSVYDITGAGDTVLAALGVAFAMGLPLPVAAGWANAAAGLQVERLGVVPVTRTELEAEFNREHLKVQSVSSSGRKIAVLKQLIPIIEAHRQAGRRIVFTNGCFDLLHAGHLQCLQEAAALGDLLIVAVNSDASVRRLKGPSRPVIPEDQRAALLAAMECVDHVLIFDDDTPHNLLCHIRPDLLVKGGTTTGIVGREIVEAYGGAVHATQSVDRLSTTQLLNSIQAQACLPSDDCEIHSHN